jgi:circadian clock protein KaiC
MSGLETHLTTIHRAVDAFKPSVVIADPITNLIGVGQENEVKSMLTRLIDYLKTAQVTTLFTSLTSGGASLEQSEVGISSLMDTWMILRDIESDGERNRRIMILKSRGMAHSNQIREFLLTSRGITLEDVYLGPSGVLTGSARAAQEAKERMAEGEAASDLERKRREIERKRVIAEAQIAALRAGMEADEEEIGKAARQEKNREKALAAQREQMAVRRGADGTETRAHGSDKRRKK